MSITGEINELKSIDQEISRLSNILKELRSKKKIIEKKITEFIEKQEQSGLKYKGKQYNCKVAKVSDRKRTLENKKMDGCSVLEKYGIEDKNAQVIMKEIMTAMKGTPIEQTKLVVKNLKK